MQANASRDDDPSGPGRGSHLDDVRRQNLSHVLRLVHAGAPITRAELTHVTGLSRSTIATIAAELEELGLVEVHAAVGGGRIGRPSVALVPSDRVAAVAVAPEVDVTTVSLIALGGRVLRAVRVPHGRIPTVEEAVDAAAVVVEGMRSDTDGRQRILGVGLAVPGLVRTDGLVTTAPYLGWADAAVASSLGGRTGLPVTAANDATCGVRAEALFGAARSERDVVYLNGGAGGIGAGVIASGVVLAGRSGFAGEIGHTTVRSGGRRCQCGASGCLETEVRRSDLVAVLGAEEEMFDLARRYASDARVRDVVDRQVDDLGIGIANVVNVFNPSVVVLGGFLGALLRARPDALGARVRERALRGPADDVRLSAAGLEDDAVPIGAAELVFTAILADPALVRGAADASVSASSGNKS